MTTSTILVTGATGKIGRQVVRHLREAGRPVRALTRDPARADLPDDVEVVPGDFGDLDSLAEALAGVAAAHLLAGAGPGNDLNGTRPEDLVALVEKAGVERVTLVWNGTPGPLEEAFAASSVGLTRVEPATLMGNTLVWADDVRAGVVTEPFVDAAESLVDERDVGAVVSEVLVNGGHEGRRYVLTGREPVSVRQKVATLARALGREIRLVELTEEQARQQWKEAGYDDELVELLVAWQQRPPSEAGRIDPALPTILGRPARTFEDWVADHLDAFR